MSAEGFKEEGERQHLGLLEMFVILTVTYIKIHQITHLKHAADSILILLQCGWRERERGRDRERQRKGGVCYC